MDNRSIPIAGGLGGAAILAFVLSPWSPSNNTVASQPAANTQRVADVRPSNTTTSPVAYSLSESEDGPWYALCKVFDTSDPEDTQTRADHRILPQPGEETHPPLAEYQSGRAERLQGEIKEETVTIGNTKLMFVPQYHHHADISSCLPPKSDILITFFIATIPDPLGSHLALQFDRNIVAIERAAESHGFGFERYWFPWNGIIKADEAPRSTASADTHSQQLKEQPGILIFRKFNKPSPPDTSSQGKASPTATHSYSSYSPRLIVFLVGETPTAGINKVAFTKAVRYIRQIEERTGHPSISAQASAQLHSGKREKEPSTEQCNTLPRIAVLGPLFSASFSPLYRTLYDLRYESRPLGVCAHILSPTTTVEDIRKTFSTELRQKELGYSDYLSPPTDVTEDAMLRYLDTLGYDPAEIASLSEDETAYGSSIERGNPGDGTNTMERTRSTLHPADNITRLVYPRDLSSLRNTWQASSFDITPADISGNVVKARLVPFSLHEQPSNELDSPSAFAPEQATPDIDQALGDLSTIIRHRRIRALIVTASNPLDEAYLLQYFRQATPDVRLATYDQDALMLRATAFANLRGTISVTRFPLDDNLSLRNGDGGTPVATTDFPNSAAEAVYIGADKLLDSVHGINVSTQLPSTYLLGNDTFWPVENGGPLTPLLIPSGNAIIPWTWYILIVALVSLVLFHLYHFRGLYRSQGRPFRTSRWADKVVQDYFLLMGNNQLVILLFFLALPSVVTFGYLVAPLPKVIVCAEVLALILMSGASIVLSTRIIKEIRYIARHPHSAGKSLIRAKDIVAVIVYPVVTITMWLIVMCMNEANFARFVFAGTTRASICYRALRTMSLMDGLSPLPLAASVIVGWYLFAVIGLSAAQTMKQMRVSTILVDSNESTRDSQWMIALAESQRTLQCEVDNIVGLDARGCLILGVGFVVLIGLQSWAGMRGIDVAWFRGWLFCGGVGLLAITLVSQFSRLWGIWKRLESLLRLLEASPLANGFDQLPSQITSVKIWRLFESWRSEALQVHALALLRQTVSSAPSDEWEMLSPHLDKVQRGVDSFLYTKNGIRRDHVVLNVAHDSPFAFFSVEGKNGSALAVTSVSKTWFQQEWQQRNPLVVEYAALRYLALIKYVNAQMRWLLLFVLYGYLFLILGLETYPFQGQHSISSILTIIFAILFSWSAVIFVQMDSNPLLSRLEHTVPGKADYFEAGQRLLAIGGIPLIAVLASQFPAIERFLLSWVKPTLDSIH